MLLDQQPLWHSMQLAESQEATADNSYKSHHCPHGLRPAALPSAERSGVPATKVLRELLRLQPHGWQVETRVQAGNTKTQRKHNGFALGSLWSDSLPFYPKLLSGLVLHSLKGN